MIALQNAANQKRAATRWRAKSIARQEHQRFVLLFSLFLELLFSL